MGEFEIQQLLVATRLEFDLGTAVFVLLSLAVMALAASTRLCGDAISRRLLAAAYLIAAAFVFLRVLAAIIRFAKLMRLLGSSGASLEVTNLAVQLPTLALRGGVFVIFIWLTLRVIRQSRTSLP